MAELALAFGFVAGGTRGAQAVQVEVWWQHRHCVSRFASVEHSL
jgi:hypothetical protein